MDNFFIALVNSSITAGWVVLAVLLLRLALRNAPKWSHCLLWGVVGLRLLLPFSLESVFSLIPSTTTIDTTVYEHRPSIQTGVPVIDESVNDYLGSHYFEGVTVPQDHFVNITAIAAGIWLVGVVLLLAYGVFSYGRLYRQVGASLRYRDNVYVCDEVTSPFILGIIRPRIYLPSGLPAEQVEPILRHEQAHLARRDHWWKPLGYLLLTVHWFNPLIWVAYILLCRDIELACDEKAIRDMDNADKKGYSEALAACSTPRRTVLVCPLAFGEVGVKDRIRSVLQYKKPAFWIVAVAAVACAAVALCFLTDPLSATWRSDNVGIVSVVAAAECDNVEYAYVSGTIRMDNPHITVKWTNRTDDTLCFGTKYTLYKDDEPCPVKGVVAWDLVLNIVQPGGWMEEAYNLGCYELDITAGSHYRLEQEFYLKSDPDTIYRAYVRFQIDQRYAFIGVPYVGEQVVYRNGYLSYHYTVDAIPQFIVSDEDLHLGTSAWPQPSTSSTYYDLGELQPIKLEKANFDELLGLPLWEDGYSAAALRKNNRHAFSVTDAENDRFYYLLEQKNGDIYIADGRINPYRIDWIFKMTAGNAAATAAVDSETESVTA